MATNRGVSIPIGTIQSLLSQARQHLTTSFNSNRYNSEILSGDRDDLKEIVSIPIGTIQRLNSKANSF